jgi:hypothetical protein
VAEVDLVAGFDTAGSTGHTVRLAGSAAGTALLRAAFKRLAAGDDAISLADLDGVELDSIAGPDLRLQPRPGRIQLIARHRPVVILDRTADQWQPRARLPDPLIDQPGTGSSIWTTTAPPTPPSPPRPETTASPTSRTAAPAAA